jgi:hypothetical protein
MKVSVFVSTCLYFVSVYYNYQRIFAAQSGPMYVGTPHWNVSLFPNFIPVLPLSRNRGSSGSIVFDYGLEDQAIRVRSPAETKDFSSIFCVQTGSEAHPESCTMGTGVLSPGVKSGQGVTLTTHRHLVPRSGMSRSYTSYPPSASVACSGTALLYAPNWYLF